MAFLPIITPQKLTRIVRKQGFVFDRQSGSHAVFIHSDGRRTSIPMHRKTLGKGLLHKILKDIEITSEDFRELV